MTRCSKRLLEDRFKMPAHREMKTIPAYALVIGKDGLKIRKVEPGEGKTNAFGSRFIGTKVTMNRLTQFLSRMLDRPVIDKNRDRECSLMWPGLVGIVHLASLPPTSRAISTAR